MISTIRTMTLRADEVRRGDVISVRGVVGTVTDVIVYGGNLPRVDVTIEAGMAGTVRDVFARDRAIVTERNVYGGADLPTFYGAPIDTPAGHRWAGYVRDGSVTMPRRS